LTEDLNDDKPNFVMIKNIFLYGSHRIIFECCFLSTVDFYEHVYDYEVKILESNRKFIFQTALLSPIPNTLNVASDGIKYVTIRDPL